MAFVEPFYAQAHAPMAGFGLSPSLKNAAEWWIKFLSLAAAVKLSVKRSTRETVWAWTDACGEEGGPAAVICSSGNWYYTSLDVPDSVLEQLLRRGDEQINFLELFTVVLLVETFVGLLSGNAVFCFIDKNGVLRSLIKGSCKALEASMSVGRVWLHPAQHDWVPFWVRVESEANVADGRSRHDFTEELELGTKWVNPVFPGWVSHLWVVN